MYINWNTFDCNWYQYLKIATKSNKYLILQISSLETVGYKCTLREPIWLLFREIWWVKTEKKAEQTNFVHSGGKGISYYVFNSMERISKTSWTWSKMNKFILCFFLSRFEIYFKFQIRKDGGEDVRFRQTRVFTHTVS